MPKSLHPAPLRSLPTLPTASNDRDGRRVHTWSGRHWTSRVLHVIGESTSRSGAGLIAAAIVLAWVVFGVVTEFPGWWDNVLYVASSTITLIMVFAIQHTQSRQQAATQRKLDELLRALPRADDRLIAVEEASDGELEDLASEGIARRDRALQETSDR